MAAAEDSAAVNVAPEVADLLRRAIDAAQSSERQEATRLLQQVTHRTPELVDGWAWLAYSTDDPLERVGSLQRVMALDPGNQEVREWLQRNGFPEHKTEPDGPDDTLDQLWETGESDTAEEAARGAEELPTRSEIEDALLVEEAHTSAADAEDESPTPDSGPDLEDVDFTPLPRTPSTPDFAELMRELSDSPADPSAAASRATPSEQAAEAGAVRAAEAAETAGAGIDAAVRDAQQTVEHTVIPTAARTKSPATAGAMGAGVEEEPEAELRARVLVVSSDPKALEFSRVEFENQGCKVSAATDSHDAQRKAATFKPDLIFCASPADDMGDALELCRTLKSLPETAGVAFVLHSEGAGMLVKLRARTTGVDEVISQQLTAESIAAIHSKRLS